MKTRSGVGVSRAVRVVLAVSFVVVAWVVADAAAPVSASDATEPSTSDILPQNDAIVTLDFPAFVPFTSEGTTAGFSDPTGLIDYYEFTSHYTLGTDRIAVFTCPAAGPVGRTAAQATAIGNDQIRDHFAAMSEGRYDLVFVAGADIPVAQGGSQQGCYDYAVDHIRTTYSGPDVHGVVFVMNISGGFASPGSTCAPLGWCPTFPDNSRYGFITDSSLIAMVWAHEHGHMITWPHSNSGPAPGGSEYDNPMDLMSGNSKTSGGTNSAPYETIVANRLAAGWVDPSDVLFYDGSSTVIDLATTGTDGTQMVVLELDDDRFWSIGARISDVSDPIPGDWSGIEVMYVENCGQGCYPLDREQITADQTPWVRNTVPVHVLRPGESETLEGYTLTVLGRDGDSVQIQLSNGVADYVERLAGSNRYSTAAEVSKAAFPDAGAVDVVFVATGANFPDALGAAAAGGHLGAPVLLVGDSVPSATASELSRLGPKTIYVVGGSAVVSDAVVGQLQSFGSVVRLAGSNRYSTAAEVSKAAFPDAGAVDVVFVATGANFPDALGAAAAGGHLGAPVLLVGDSVPSATASELSRLGPKTVYAAGGTAVIPNSVLAGL